jgi:hypothetical protein
MNSEIIEFNTSNLENRLVDKNLEKEKSLAVKNALKQSMIEERLANNALKISVALYILIVIILQSILWAKVNIQELVISEDKKFFFNFVDMEFINSTSDISISYNCIFPNENGCHVNLECDIPNEIVGLLKKDQCGEFQYMNFFGVAVIIINIVYYSCDCRKYYGNS